MTDVTGTWLGTYWQLGQPTRFELSLVQHGSHISGRVLDDSHLGGAIAHGDLIGREIRFVKRYISATRHSVEYIGRVSEDGNTMQGQWHIGLLTEGEWEAHRNGENLTLALQLSRMV